MQDDLISRQAVINSIANTNFWLSAENWQELMKAIDSVPSVQPEQRWIPVTERVPEDRGYYLVTILAENGYHRSREVIYFGDDFKWSTTRNVIAWMPLLEPWKEK